MFTSQFTSHKAVRFGAAALVFMACILALRPTAHAQTSTPTADDARKAMLGAAWGKNTSIEFDKDGNAIIRSNGLPNHEILEAYQAVSVIDNKSTYVIKTQEQRMKITIPLQPRLAEKKTDSKIGLIGIAISGALIYSPFEADGKTMALSQKDLVVDGVPFFDSCNGHPNPFAVQYHYHGIPTCVTEVIDKKGEHSRLLGYLLDGFPVYGPQGKDGKILTPKDLDECNGVFSPTPEFPDGVYHYVITDEPPYTMPCYSGEITLDTSTLGLFTRGVDLSYPPPPIPPEALRPPKPSPKGTAAATAVATAAATASK
jgi:hypothetical protein